MIPITEAEAANLMCPFARPLVVATRIDGAPFWVAEGPGSENITCVGRACMLWQWDRQYVYASEDEVKEMPLLEVDRPLSISNLRNAARAAKLSSPLASCYIVRVSEQEARSLWDGLFPTFLSCDEYGSLRRIPGDVGACEMFRFQCETMVSVRVSTGTCGAAR